MYNKFPEAEVLPPGGEQAKSLAQGGKVMYNYFKGCMVISKAACSRSG